MSADTPAAATPQEGDLYKTLFVAGRDFTIRYGYYTNLDRESGEPIPIFPDFAARPLYTEEGRPYCTRLQDACPHYAPRRGGGDGWCGDCAFYPDPTEEMGVCRCKKREITKENTVQKEEQI